MKIVNCCFCLNKFNLDYASYYEKSGDGVIECPHCKCQFFEQDLFKFQPEYDKYLMKQKLEDIILTKKAIKLLNDSKN